MSVKPTRRPTPRTPQALSDPSAGECAFREEVSAMKRMPNGNGGGGP